MTKIERLIIKKLQKIDSILSILSEEVEIPPCKQKLFAEKWENLRSVNKEIYKMEIEDDIK